MNLGLLVLRLAVGGFFVGHGAQKLFGAFGGHGLDGTGQFFESLGMRPGRQHATAAGVAEFGGGLLLIFGLFTPFAAAAITAVMVVAILTVHGKNGPWSTDGGYEYNVVLAAAVFCLAGVGAGSVSLDHAFGLHLSGTGWALGELAAGILGAIAAVLVGRRETAAPVAAAPASATPAERFARTETPADRPRTPAADPRFRAPGGDERAADEEFDRLPRS